MSPLGSIPLMPLSVVVLCGCAVSAQPSSAAAPERDCSFRSATTCWTVAGRFPAPRPEPRDSVPTELLSQPRAILASGADTTAAR
jgi:hypothetical protein